MVASTTKQTYKALLCSAKPGWLRNNKTLPVKAIIIPKILLDAALLLKNNAPQMITKMGVREFKTPAKELSMPCSAIQNKYAGMRLPKTPDINMMNILSFGISRKVLIAVGNRTNPEEMILKDATWKGVRLIRPSFIKIKLLPQINESAIKSSQFKNLLFNVYIRIFECAKVNE